MYIDLIMRAMEWVWRLIWLSFLWMLFSLPIITLIPSTVAMFSVAHGWFTEDHDIDIFPQFIKGFKKYFFKSYGLGLILIVIGIFLFLDLLILQKHAIGLFLVVRYAIMVVSLFYCLMVFYCLAIFVHVDLSLPKIFMIAFLIVLRQPLVSLLMLCGVLAIVAVFLLWTGFGLLFLGSTIATFSVKAMLAGSRNL